MQVVRFTYDSTEVKISVFLLLYLRMSGIYIYERYFNLESAVCNKMLNALPDTEEHEFMKSYNPYDMELYLVRNQDEFRAFQQYGYTENTILLTMGDTWVSNIEADINKERTIHCSEEKLDTDLLDSLLERMYQNKMISHNAFKSLQMVAAVYCKHNIMQLSFCAKYFYTAENDDDYGKVIDRYQKAIDDLFKELGKENLKWGDVLYIHLQYSVLFLIYEGNLHCLRHGKPFLYTPESAAKVCEVLLSKKEVVLLLGDSIHLLAAQIYGDLLKKTNDAYQHYLAACKEYSAYAYYKKAIHLIEVEESYDMAVKYLARSLEIYPPYYRAWHMLGICYMNLTQWEKAVQAFDNLQIILSPRLKHKLLRPLEIEYLFKAANQAGDILLEKIQQIPQAINEYLFAEETWKMINETLFFSFAYKDPLRVDYVKHRMKKELNISRVYIKLSEIYQLLGEDEKASYYLKEMSL